MILTKTISILSWIHYGVIIDSFVGVGFYKCRVKFRDSNKNTTYLAIL